MVWLLGDAAVGRGGGPGRGVPRASRLGTGAGPLPGAGASGCPTTRLSPDPLFGALLPPLPVNLRSGTRDLHRTQRIQILTTRLPPAALLRQGIHGTVRSGSVAVNICFRQRLGTPTPCPVNKLPRSDPRSRPLVRPQTREKSSFLRQK